MQLPALPGPDRVRHPHLQVGRDAAAVLLLLCCSLPCEECGGHLLARWPGPGWRCEQCGLLVAATEIERRELELVSIYTGLQYL